MKPDRGIAVVGGEPSNDRRIAGIVFQQDGERRVCSGLLVSAHLVLTAAHCACRSTDFKVSNENYVSDRFRRASLVAIFPGYRCNDRTYVPRGDDLALLAVQGKLYTEKGDAICSGYSLIDQIEYAAHWFPVPPDHISVAGYGFSGPSAREIGSRAEAVVSVNSMLCATPSARGLACAPFLEFIAGNTSVRGVPHDTCGGDSGGPAYLRTKDRFFLVGIVSRALAVDQAYADKDCGSGGIYTHLGRSDVIAWLRANGVTDPVACSQVQAE